MKVKPVLYDLPREHTKQVVIKYRFISNEVHCGGKLKLVKYHCLIEVVTNAV